MSFPPGGFRKFARAGRGGRAANHFRGASSSRYVPRGTIGTLIFRSPGARQNRAISGVTLDASGSPLGGCRVELYQTGGDIPTATTTSDGAGGFVFDSPGSGPFYLVAYKTGVPDVAGTSVNTLIAT